MDMFETGTPLLLWKIETKERKKKKIKYRMR